MTEQRQQPAAIVRSPLEVLAQTVAESSNVELVQELITRASTDRKDQMDAARRCRNVDAANSAEVFDAAARDLSLAITHLEDARTRLNAAAYRIAGKFSISDAQR